MASLIIKSAAPRPGPEPPQRLAVSGIIVLFVGKKRKKRKKFELQKLADGKVKVSPCRTELGLARGKEQLRSIGMMRRQRLLGCSLTG